MGESFVPAYDNDIYLHYVTIKLKKGQSSESWETVHSWSGASESVIGYAGRPSWEKQVLRGDRAPEG